MFRREGSVVAAVEEMAGHHMHDVALLLLLAPVVALPHVVFD